MERGRSSEMNVKKRKNIPRVLVGILAIVWFAGLAFFAPDAMAAIAFRVTAINEGSGTTASTAKPGRCGHQPQPLYQHTDRLDRGHGLTNLHQQYSQRQLHHESRGVL
jgi:hypothetical protein